MPKALDDFLALLGMAFIFSSPDSARFPASSPAEQYEERCRSHCRASELPSIARSPCRLQARSRRSTLIRSATQTALPPVHRAYWLHRRRSPCILSRTRSARSRSVQQVGLSILTHQRTSLHRSPARRDRSDLSHDLTLLPKVCMFVSSLSVRWIRSLSRPRLSPPRPSRSRPTPHPWLDLRSIQHPLWSRW